MSFDTIEISNQDGKPIFLYEFVQGVLPSNGRGWFFNTSDRDIVYNHPVYGNTTYVAEAISDGGVTISGGSEDNEITITVPFLNAVSQLFTATPPSTKVNVTIRALHYGDTDAPIHWMGTVSSRKVPQDGEAQLLCNAVIASFSVGGLRLCYERQCPHPLYSLTTCKAVKVPVSCVITALTGDSITADNFATMSDGKFNGGYVEWPIVGTLMESRSIDQHTGTTVTLLGSTDGLAVGMTITAFIGCDHSRQGCNDDHSNLPNYGGFAHMPGRSPFDGDPVF
jgi:uncharacterized phage protein (TIGR02218 family)